MFDKIRSRMFCLLLYTQEDTTHKNALDYLIQNYDIAYIEHNLDTNEHGEILKPHTHVVLRCQNAKWNTALSEELQIPVNYIQKCRSMEYALEYLIHYNDETKHQYDLDDVQGNLREKLKRSIKNSNKDENEKTLELIAYIEEYKGYLSVSTFSKYCCELGMWDVFRRASSIYISIINEHNLKYRS